MASYLAGIKGNVKEIFDAAFEELWKEVIEPALKQSYRNGFADGQKQESGTEETAAEGKPNGRRFQRRKAGAS